MPTIDRSPAFRKDYKRVLAVPRHSKDAEKRLLSMLTLLLEDQPLPVAGRDHALTDDWKGYRECHVKPDLLLIYKMPDAETLRVARLGSHGELFG